MIPATQHELIEKLADLQQLSPDVRFGQLLANLGFLVEDPCSSRFSGRAAIAGEGRRDEEILEPLVVIPPPVEPLRRAPQPR